MLGNWREAGSTPANALLLQGAITLVLVAASSITPDGFTAMVAYTSPVFWTFFLLTATHAVRVPRDERRGARRSGCRSTRSSRPPSALACVYMLYSSINYVRFAVDFGMAVFAGLAIMAAGIPVYFLVRNR